MCTVLLPPGDNPITVNKYIYIYIYIRSVIVTRFVSLGHFQEEHLGGQLDVFLTVHHELTTH